MDKKIQKIISVAFPIPVQTIFSYLASNNVMVGSRVKVLLGTKETIGVVVPTLEISGVPQPLSASLETKNLKPIIEILDKEPLITKELFDLAVWMHRYYFCSLGEALWGILPKKWQASNRKLKDPFDYPTKSQNFLKPTKYQQLAIDKIKTTVSDHKYQKFLLNGVAGSGKTEVYLHAIKAVLEINKTAIYLVPEIALTPQTLNRLKARFGDIVGVLHSQMTARARFLIWQRIKKGDIKILLGPRSAVFAPFQNLGVIIIDEEHDDSYKQDSKPNYDAREVAQWRAKFHKILLITGTATPSIEMFYHYQKQDDLEIIDMPKKIASNQRVEVTAIDMREELKRKNFSVLSKYLEKKIMEKLIKKEQTLLFLNRRGEATYVFCRECGFVMQCPNCDVSLVYHGDKEKLLCHYCGYSRDNVKVCPNCQSKYIKYFGSAIQKVEKYIRKVFPEAKIARLDRDISAKKDQLFNIYNNFNEGKIDILIGTQIIAKGLDFPNLTLVGVISTDTALNLPDFRANERTFDILLQVIGRAGRRDKKGEAILQTYYPNHYAIESVKRLDYQTFYNQEIAWRDELKYPPFSRLVLITLRGGDEKVVEKESIRLFDCFQVVEGSSNFEIIGPFEPSILKKYNNYRRQILIKMFKHDENLDEILRSILNMRLNKKVKINLMVNPVAML
ncbi:MAG: primosomal protein N' [bacterium]|nr:primosomal protein N' [bacterium]